MGKEAYSVGVNFQNSIKKEALVDKLISLGATKTNKGNFGDITLEVECKEGIIEILINSYSEKNEQVNEAILAQGYKINLKNSFNKGIIRFAKPNSIVIVDKAEEMIKELENFF